MEYRENRDCQIGKNQYKVIGVSTLTIKSVDSKERTIGGSSEKEGIKANMEKGRNVSGFIYSLLQSRSF